MLSSGRWDAYEGVCWLREASLRGVYRSFFVILSAQGGDGIVSSWDHLWLQERWWSHNIDRTWSLMALWSCPSNSRWMILFKLWLLWNFCYLKLKQIPTDACSQWLYFSHTVLLGFEHTKYNSNSRFVLTVTSAWIIFLLFLWLFWSSFWHRFIYHLWKEALAFVTDLTLIVTLIFLHPLTLVCLGKSITLLRIPHLFNCFFSVSPIKYNL